MKNVIIIFIGRYTPFFPLKNWLYRTFLRMEIGEHTALAFMVMPDILFPEKIRIGNNTIIGYNTTILAHEYLVNEYRLGDVIIGDDVMIGANTTILPGVTIGDRAVVSAGSSYIAMCQLAHLLAAIRCKSFVLANAKAFFY
ncbi:2,3,4,5-tetrahydropyridine-2,6-dicarboxylate N-acetyltransferase [Anoxybacillus sp. BCO1]|nr:2,3,4,5-tetrahydropyridine-2,6-dicarboxylate N-acetyltransferase [Anoxybacillus sp. BCO1]